MEPKITGWAFTDAKNHIGCPKCGAEKGEPCRTPKNRKANIPHTQRRKAYWRSIGSDEFNRRHRKTPEPIYKLYLTGSWKRAKVIA